MKYKNNFYKIYSLNVYIYTVKKTVSLIFYKVIKNFNKSMRNGQNTYANIMKSQWLTRNV